MAIGSYPRTIQNGQLATNGNANAGTGLMLWDSTQNKYIAATPSTFAGGGGAGGATAANQETQISQLTTINETIFNFRENNDENLVSVRDKLNTLILIFQGVEPSLLSAGVANLAQDTGVQIGNEFVSSLSVEVTQPIQIKGLTNNIAEVNASNQLKTTAV